MYGIGKYGACSDPMYRELNKSKCADIIRKIRLLHNQTQQITIHDNNLERTVSIPPDPKRLDRKSNSNT